MALSASLSLDIKKFEAGLEKAAVELQTFERATKNTNRDLKRLMEDVSGQKIAVEAARVAEAVTRIGGASRLTEAEQKRVNATVTEAINKYRALGQEAPAHLVKLQSATASVEKQTSSLTASIAQMAASFTIAGLAERAIRAAVSGIGEFVTRGGEVSGMRNAFDRLSGGVDQANARIAVIRTSTLGLVGDMEAMQASNKATLLGLGLNDAQMGEMAKTATILGRAMGQGATKSLDDLITALGRSSPMILDNLGLSVKVGEANEAYAAALGKTADALTDAEKKQAFMNAAMDAAREKTKQLGDIQLNAADHAAQLWTGVKNLTDATASWAVSLGPVNSALGATVDSMRLWEELLRTGKLSATLKEFQRQQGDGRPLLPEPPKGWQQLPPVLGAVVMSEREMAEASRKLTAEFDKQQKAFEDFNKQLRQFNGGDAAKRGEELVRVLGALGGPVRVLPSQLDAMAKAMQAASEAALLAGDMDLARQYAELAKTLSPVIQLQQRYNVTIGEFVTTSDDFSQAVADQIDALTKLEGTIAIGVLPNVGKLSQAWTPFKAAVASSLPGIRAASAELGKVADQAARREAAAGLRDLASALADLAQIGGGSDLGKLAAMIGALAVGAEGANQMRDGLDKIKEGGKGAAAGLLQMASGAVAAASALAKVTGEGSRVQRVMGGLAAGAQIGSAFGPWGAVIGGALGGLVGLFRSTKKASADVAPVLTDWTKLITESTNAQGRLHASVVATFKEMQRLGTAAKDVQDYLRGQASSALTAFNAVAAGTVRWQKYGEAVKKAREERQKALDDGSADDTAPAGSEKGKKFRELDDALTNALREQHRVSDGAKGALADLGIQAMAAFNAALASGLSYTEALKLIQPGLQSIINAHQDLGINIDDAALKALAMQSNLLEKNPEILAGLDGIAQGMIALGNLGHMNADTFAAMQRTAMDMYTRIQGEVAAMGGSTRDALLPMQNYLQEAAAQAKLLGVPLDANTQMLIDQSRELGIWKDKAIDPMEEMRDVMREVRDAIKDMADAFRGLPRRVDTKVHTTYTSEGTPPSGTGGTGGADRSGAGGGTRGGIQDRNATYPIEPHAAKAAVSAPAAAAPPVPPAPPAPPAEISVVVINGRDEPMEQVIDQTLQRLVRAIPGNQHNLRVVLREVMA